MSREVFDRRGETGYQAFLACWETGAWVGGRGFLDVWSARRGEFQSWTGG